MARARGRARRVADGSATPATEGSIGPAYGREHAERVIEAAMAVYAEGFGTG